MVKMNSRRLARWFYRVLILVSCSSLIMFITLTVRFNHDSPLHSRTSSSFTGSIIFNHGNLTSKVNQRTFVGPPNPTHLAGKNQSSSLPSRLTAQSQDGNVTFDLTIAVIGRLGNRMFQYASLLGIAHMNKRKPFYDPASTLQKTFHVTHIESRSNKGFEVAYEKDFASYDPSMEALPRKNVALLQYLQSWRYFDPIRSVIKKEFTFLQPVQEAAANVLRKHSQRIANRTTVGIHVRRGDMLISSSVRRGYHTAPASYVRSAMALMRQKHGDVIFIVVTSDVAWCAAELKGTDFDYVIADRASQEVHLALLASCRHVIMTVGTYGWWGGYLSGGDVVYYWDPKECLHDPPLPVEIKRPEDFFPPSWIPLAK